MRCGSHYLSSFFAVASYRIHISDNIDLSAAVGIDSVRWFILLGSISEWYRLRRAALLGQIAICVSWSYGATAVDLSYILYLLSSFD